MKSKHLTGRMKRSTHRIKRKRILLLLKTGQYSGYEAAWNGRKLGENCIEGIENGK